MRISRVRSLLVIIAVLALVVPLSRSAAAQKDTGLDVTIHLSQARTDDLREALALQRAQQARLDRDVLQLQFALTDASKQQPTRTPLVVKTDVVSDADIVTWMTGQATVAADSLIAQMQDLDTRGGGELDVTGLTKAQRQQVKDLIAGFRK